MLAVDRPLAFAVPERGDGGDGAEQHGYVAHVREHTRPQQIALDLDVEQPLRRQLGHALGPLEEFDEVRIDVRFVANHASGSSNRRTARPKISHHSVRASSSQAG